MHLKTIKIATHAKIVSSLNKKDEKKMSIQREKACERALLALERVRNEAERKKLSLCFGLSHDGIYPSCERATHEFFESLYKEIRKSPIKRVRAIARILEGVEFRMSYDIITSLAGDYIFSSQDFLGWRLKEDNPDAIVYDSIRIMADPIILKYKLRDEKARSVKGLRFF